MDAEGGSLIGTALATTVTGVSLSNMFEAAVSKFVKTCGKESLVSVPSLDEADRCRPFQVVVKKNRRWFWQSPKYEVSPFQLHQLLTKEDKFDDIKVNSRTLTTYNKTYTFDANGKVGAKLVSVFDLELSGSDTIDISAKFGDIVKVELDEPAFLEELQSRSLDLDHEFVCQVRADPRKTLCVVVGTAMVEAQSNIHMKVKRKGEEKEDAARLPEKITAEEEDIEIDDTTDKVLGIPKETPLAINICELSVKSNGALELMVERNSLGGFEDTGDSVDGGLNEGILEGMSLEEQYIAITTLPSDSRGQLTAAVLDICATSADISILLKMLKEGQRSAGLTPIKESHLKVCPFSNINAYATVLEMAGFIVKDNDSVIYPSELNPLLDAIRSMFEALIELDDNEMEALVACNSNYTKPLLHLLGGELDQDPLKTSDPQLSMLFSKPNPGQKFSQTLGFQVATDGTLTAADDNLAELEGAYRAVYALWWHSGMDKAPGSTWRCNIL